MPQPHWTAYNKKPHNVAREEIVALVSDCGLEDFGCSIDGYSFCRIKLGKQYPLSRREYMLTPIRCAYDSVSEVMTWTM